MRPELRQFDELSEDAFGRHPVWVGCHTVDYDEPWYDDTDEETFRPWSGEVPVQASDGMFLVRARVTFRDGSTADGFLTPAEDPNDLGMVQPHVFLDGKPQGFWWGIIDVPAETRTAFYSALGKSADQVFPATFTVDASLSDVRPVTAAGFYNVRGDGSVKILT